MVRGLTTLISNTAGWPGGAGQRRWSGEGWALVTWAL